MYIYLHTCICNVSKDINICHLTESACISDYRGNAEAFEVFFLNSIFKIEESEKVLLGNLESRIPFFSWLKSGVVPIL